MPEKTEIVNVQRFEVIAVGIYTTSQENNTCHSKTSYTLCAEIDGSLKEIGSFVISAQKDPVSDFAISQNDIVKLALHGR